MRQRKLFLAVALIVATAAVAFGVAAGRSAATTDPGGPPASAQAAPGHTLRGPLSPQQPAREPTYRTLSGPYQVVVRDLPPATVPATEQAEPLLVPRRAPDVPVRAGPPQVPEANALDSGAGPGLEPMAPPATSTTFEGLDDNDNGAVTGVTITPPDPQIAVGPNHVVEFVNIVGRITDKSGVPSGPDFSLKSLFVIPPTSFDFDPKVIYDDISGRFFAAYVEIDSSGDGILRLAVSATSDPTGLWNVYFAVFTGIFPDFPGIGVTDDKFTISYNLFPTGPGSFLGEQTLVVEKADVMAGGAAAAVFLPVNASRFTVRPAHSLSSVSDQYLVTFDGAFLPLTQMTVIRITGTPSAANVTEASATNVTILPQDSPPPSTTAGSGDCIAFGTNFGPPPCIDSGDFRALEAIWRNGRLWASASAACTPPGDGSVRSCVHLIEVNTATTTVTNDIMFGASGEYFSWPAIRTDSTGNLYVSLTHTDPSIFAEARVAGRCATDAPNTMSGSSLLRAGEIAHFTGRWGDYLGAAVDPSDPSSVWVLSQYAKNTGGSTTFGYWGTYVAQSSYGGLCGVACPPALNFDGDIAQGGPGIGNGPGISGDDGTLPMSDGICDATDADDDNDGIPDASDTDPRGDNTYDDNGDGDPCPPMGTDAADDGPSWDSNCNGILDGVEGSCPLATNPSGDDDSDGLHNTWEVCKWGTDPNTVNSDGDVLSDCKEAADVDGNGLVDFVGDAVDYAKAAVLPPVLFGRDGDFDMNGDGIVDFVVDVIEEARFALIPGLCN